MLPHNPFFHIGRPSLVRGILLAMLAFGASLRLGGFPDLNGLHSSHWQALCAGTALAGLVETGRCMGQKWSLYHAGVLILLYTDLMILGLAVFLFFFP